MGGPNPLYFSSLEVFALATSIVLGFTGVVGLIVVDLVSVGFVSVFVIGLVSIGLTSVSIIGLDSTSGSVYLMRN